MGVRLCRQGDYAPKAVHIDALHTSHCSVGQDMMFVASPVTAACWCAGRNAVSVGARHAALLLNCVLPRNRKFRTFVQGGTPFLLGSTTLLSMRGSRSRTGSQGRRTCERSPTCGALSVCPRRTRATWGAWTPRAECLAPGRCLRSLPRAGSPDLRFPGEGPWCGPTSRTTVWRRLTCATLGKWTYMASAREVATKPAWGKQQPPAT